MIKAIIFDFDGVLVESVDIKTKAFAGLFEHEGDSIVRRVVAYHIKNAGVSRFEKFRHIYKEMLDRELTEETFDYLCKKFSELVVDEVVNAPYVKGAKEFLENCASLYDCYIASATPHEEMEEIAKRRGIASCFKAIYGAPRKKADIVRTILDRHGLSPEDVVYIGDALSDYLAANENKVFFIARVTNDNSRIFKDADCIKMNDLMNLKEAISSFHCQKDKILG